MNAVLMQNRGDRSFAASGSSPEVVAAAGAAVHAVVGSVGVPVGVHLLRNDTLGSVGMARATGASYVRAAVLTGRSESAQGTLEGRPDEVLRYRATVGGHDIALLADVATMHNVRRPEGVEAAASDAVFFGGAAAVVVADPSVDTALRTASRRRWRACRC